MITGDRSLAQGKRGAFWNTLEEFHVHWRRIDVICPNAGIRRYGMTLFGNVHIHPSPLPLSLQWLWIWYAGRRIVHERHPVLATVHEYPFVFNGVGARLLHRSTGIPYVLEVHHIVGYPEAANIHERLGRWLTRLVLPFTARHAKAVRVVNAHQAPQWLRSIGIPEQKIVIIPSAYIDHEVFRPDPTVQKRYDIAFVGRMARNKGINLFLDVLERTGLTGVAVGDGQLFDRARREARRRSLKLHFTGFVHNSAAVAGILRTSRLLVMPSYNEGGPRIVLEALACGVPVVATPVGIVPDVLPPEAIEEWDAVAFADKVLTILHDAALYERLRASGLQVVKQYERHTAITAYADGLKKLIPELTPHA